MVEEPWPPGPVWTHRRVSSETERAFDAVARSVRLQNQKKAKRPDGSVVAETTLWVRLNDASGAPARPTPPPWPKLLLPSAALAAMAPTDGDGPPRTDECRTTLEGLAREANALRQRAVRYVSGAVLHAQESPDPAFTRKVQASLDAAIANTAGGAPGALVADCRGIVCALAPSARGPVSMEVVKSAVGAVASRNELKRVDIESRNGRLERAGYVVLRPLPPGARSGKEVIQVFVSGMRSSREVAACKAGQRGTGPADMRIVLPAVGETTGRGQPRRLSVHLAGPGAETPLGRCLQEALTSAAARFPLPEGVIAAEVSRSFDLDDL